MRILTEKDYRVMSKLLNSKENKGLSKITGMTRRELEKQCDVSYSKVRDALDALMEYGYVENGISKGKEMTYYITTKGIKELQEISKSIVYIKEDNNNE